MTRHPVALAALLIIAACLWPVWAEAGRIIATCWGM